MESEGQEALEEDEALKTDEEDVALISDDEEFEESQVVEGNIAAKVKYQADVMLPESDRPSTHNKTYDLDGEEEEEEEEVGGGR